MRKSQKAAIIIGICFLLIAGVRGERYRASCRSTADCLHIYGPEYECLRADHTCRHKPLFPLARVVETQQVIGLVLIVLLSVFANMGGIGGNGLFSPIAIWLLDYNAQEGGAVTKAMVLAGSSVNVLFLLFKPNPDKKKETMIDFGLSAIIFPTLLAGTMTGVTITKVLPPILILVVPAAFLWISAWSLFKRARSYKPTAENTPLLLQEENKTKEIENKSKLSSFPSIRHSNDGSELNQVRPSSRLLSVLVNRQSAFKLPEHIDESERHRVQSAFLAPLSPFSLKNILLDTAVILLCLAVVTLVSLLRGGQGFASLIGIDTCSFWSWSLYLGAQIFCLFFSLLEYRRHISRLAGPINTEQNASRVKALMWWSYLAGVGSSFIGIGSSIILSPVMIGLEFLPNVASSICTFSSMLTSASATFQFYVQGAIDPQNTAILMVASAFGSAFSFVVLSILFRYYSQSQVLLWVIFGLVLTSALAVPIAGASSSLSSSQAFLFEPPC